jgi:hypothetical protein
MKKFRLEDINKQQAFTEPPEGYFDRLPGIIQSKTTQKERGPITSILFIRALKMVPVAALLVLIAIFTGIIPMKEAKPDFDEILSEVSSEDIIQYLEELDISNEEILEEADLAALSMEFEAVEDPLMEALDIEDETILRLFDETKMEDGLL